MEMDKDVSSYNAFKTPARSRYFLSVGSLDDIPVLNEAVKGARSSNLPILFLGGGTNCLFAFDTFDGLMIRNNLKGYYFDDARRVVASSGELISALSTELYRLHGLSTFMPWVGLPGTVGGAVAGNAGCFGLEISQALVEVEAFSFKEEKIVTIGASELGFEYRNSNIKGKDGLFLLSARFRTEGIDHPYLLVTPEEMLVLRKSKQPPGRTCGSFFKNPPGDSAGRLIDQAGLKGFRIGGIRVSEMHGNFFLADADADWRDIIALSEHVKRTVKEKFDIDLHEEVRIITN